MTVDEPTTQLPLWRRVMWPLAIAALILSASQHSDIAAPAVTNIDKFSHFGVFGLLATLTCRCGRPGWRSALWALLAVSAFGASDEWHQSFVPGRSSELADWIADTSGAALAVSLYTGWPRYRRLLEARLWGRRFSQPVAEPELSSIK